MQITLKVVAGAHAGQTFSFDRHDTFLVGRSRHAHFQLPAKDRYFSRIHFMMEVNPPQCRLVDMGSHNGTYVNGQRVFAVDLKPGDKIRAGHTTLELGVEGTPGVPVAVPIANPVTGSSSMHDPLPEIPGFSVVGFLGRGTLGAVYLAQALDDGRQAAIKVIHPEVQPEPAQSAEFLRGVRPLLDLDHPHLVRLRDLGLVSGGFFFVYDYIPGRSAGEIVGKRGPLSVVRAVRWTCQILQALGHAHACGFVHSDVKPGNVLVFPGAGKDQIKLADFGLARVYHAAPFSGLTVTNELLDTTTHRPPEFLLNYQKSLPAADQYAVAATLYYMLTGAKLLDMPKEIHRRFSTILKHEVVPVQDRRPDVPTPLANVIHKALARAPEQRFKTVTEFRRALIHSVQSESAD